VPSKDYIFKRGSISIPIIPDVYFTTVTVGLISNYVLLIYAAGYYFYQKKGIHPFIIGNVSFYCHFFLPGKSLIPMLFYKIFLSERLFAPNCKEGKPD